MENALELAKDTYVDVNIFDDEHKEKVKSLQTLPFSCWDSALKLEEQADIYKKYDVFSQNTIDGIIRNLKKFDDKNLRQELNNNNAEMIKLVQKFFHCG